jgi:hypothetical protein
MSVIWRTDFRLFMGGELMSERAVPNCRSERRIGQARQSTDRGSAGS